MIRFGLCCTFKKEPIRFRTARSSYVKKLSKPLEYLGDVIFDNTTALIQALQFCQQMGIGAFRINSQFFPLYTHPEVAYTIEKLPNGKEIRKALTVCRQFAKEADIRLTLHPDQFVVLNSLRDAVVNSSLQELEYHGILASLVGADVVNIHLGGVYGDKDLAMERFRKNFKRLSKRVKERLTIENDDKSYTPEDVLPLCKTLKIPFVYDVHHHRVNPDRLSIEQATKKAIRTWNREPLFHISSPKEGWKGAHPERHHDFINFKDFPKCWRGLDLTVEVEAKAKELAVLKLMAQLR